MKLKLSPQGCGRASWALDLIVEACPKAGYEKEWRGILERAFASGDESEAARFQEISIPAYERLGAPRVGSDDAADAWIIETRKATTPDEIAEVLRMFDGHYVLRLVTSDGLPDYTHAGLYEGVDETSFRGSFLKVCQDVLTPQQVDDAWNHKFPDAAVAYGRTLLDAARTAAANPPVKTAPKKPGLLAKLGFGGRSQAQATIDQQIAIVESAGRWFVFWGEKGHAIRAWC